MKPTITPNMVAGDATPSNTNAITTAGHANRNTKIIATPTMSKHQA